MTIIEVSKNKIIKAIKTEPLRTLKPGAWVNADTQSQIKVSSKSCSVCAVGAVMRNVIDKNQLATQIDNAAWAAVSDGEHLSPHDEDEDVIYRFAKKEVRNCRYMGALSCYFEGLCDLRAPRDEQGWKIEFNMRSSKHRKILEGIRKDVIKFVRDNFPDKIKIDIDGAKPAKDVKVISKDEE